jgi:cobalt/nickel transport system permease protein
VRRSLHDNRVFWIAGVILALFLAGFFSYYASSRPDGLEKVAKDQGIDRKAEDHRLSDSPLAEYQTKNVDNPRLSGGLAGVIGVGATLAVGTGVFWVVRRRPAPALDRSAPAPDSSAPAPDSSAHIADKSAPDSSAADRSAADKSDPSPDRSR